MPRVLISVGSNLDPERHVLAALRLLHARLPVVAVSTFYRTPASGRPEQPDFINGAVEVRTELPPREIKYGVLRAIEAELGRRRSADAHAPRPIDLDLALYGDVQVAEEGLVVPDPEIIRRPFLAHPLAELAPELVVPGVGETLAGIAARLSREEMQPLPEYTDRVRRELSHEP